MYITIAGQGLDGQIPSELTLLTSLKEVSLPFNFFSEEIPDEFASVQTLERLDLQGNLISGRFLETLHEANGLPNIQSINIGDNFLSGSVPVKIGMFPALETFLIHNNDLDGPLSNNWHDKSSLKSLWLHGNTFTGTIPESFGNLGSLTSLRFSDNNIVGLVPEELSFLSDMRELWTQFNQLEGSIPTEVCNLVDSGDLNVLEADCLPVENPPVSCGCCSLCCDRDSEMCLAAADVTPEPTPAPSISHSPTIDCAVDLLFRLELTTDDYPSETSWILTNENTGEIVAVSQRDLAASTTYRVQLCLDPDIYYSFVIRDSQGDGICVSSRLRGC